MSPRAFYTNPVENLRSYIMVHGGLDRTERLQDVEWIEDLLDAAKEHLEAASKLADLFVADNEVAALQETQRFIQSEKGLKEVMPTKRHID